MLRVFVTNNLGARSALAEPNSGKPMRQMIAAWRERLRLAGIGILSGIIVGGPASLAARLTMAAIAVQVGENPAITLATLTIMAAVIRESIVAGLLYTFITRYTPGKNDTIKGLGFGGLLMLLFLLFFLLPPPPESVEAPILSFMLFTLLCLAFGISVAKLVALLERSFPAPRLHPPYLAAAYAPIMFLVGISVIFFIVGDMLPLIGSGFRLVWMT